MNITPLKQKILKFINRSHITLQDLSTKRWTISPSELQRAAPAIYLDKDLIKITSVMEDTTLEQEITRIRGGLVEHAATVAYQISDCQLINGSIYKSAVRYPLIRRKKQFLIDFNHQEEIGEAALASTYYGGIYFGHWLSDDLSLCLAAQTLATPVIAARTAYGHEAGYSQLSNIHPVAISTAIFNKLFILDDFGQNKFKLERYQKIRQSLSLIPARNHGGKIFIRRGHHGVTRILINEPEILKLLISQGFKILDPEKSTATEIVATLQGAHMVVGLEGSHLLHSIYTMAENGGLCVLQPPYRFNNVIKNYTDCLGIRYGFVIGDITENGFSINPAHLFAVLEKIDNVL